MMKPMIGAVLLALTLSACGGGAGSNALPSTPTVTNPNVPQASGRIAFSSPTFSAPSFNANNEMESGSCATNVQFTGTSEWATFAINEDNYSGPFTASEVVDPNENVNASNPPTQVPAAQTITSAVSGSTLTIKTIGAGLVDVTVSDSLGHSATCQVGVTVTAAVADSEEHHS
uniref:Uncharacterized protein n=1 Tax=mine drainage metagenome TaxID=410659 RepID=E6Q2R9_9ZZZZ